jgi:hypothetical protein
MPDDQQTAAPFDDLNDLRSQILNAAVAAHRDWRGDEAAEGYRRVSVIRPDDFDAMHLSGALARAQGSPIIALRRLNRARLLDSVNPAAQENSSRCVVDVYNVCIVAQRNGDDRSFVEAADLLADAGSPLINPETLTEIGKAAGNAVFSLSRSDDPADVELSLRAVRLAWRLAPSDNSATLLRIRELELGNYERAWNPSVWLRQIDGRSAAVWSGQKHDGRLIITNANGAGDFVQFLRFLPQARRRVGRLGLMVNAKLRKLVQDSPMIAGVDLLESDPQEPNTRYCDIFALPAAMGLSRRDAAPSAYPYVISPPEEQTAWERLLRKDRRPLIGLVWASWNNGNGDFRAVSFDFFAEMIASNPDAMFIGLHSGFGKMDLRKVDFPDNFRFFGVVDLPTTRDILSRLDLVIAPDGGLSHLSCALARKTWVLLSRWCDWRWRSPDESSEWYPSARLFRQPTEGRWDEMKEKTSRELAAFIKDFNANDGRLNNAEEG